eukprot:gnl/TRDRNA2_/TRDRNA2_156130_c0_seq2.p2 gnl/TRDRNA2_/TRDRNA2_156130_c0~~gnl/TRDRNA2_/TRDRNA2_156130_c0_seq2.p2  ORF type:complete len:109 (-),score=11.54 gnl/TRDRNA2_/TRDRNA2_156130_c0_seq2:150-476(-)
MLLVAYTFGESDLYWNLEQGREIRMWMLKTLGFILPIFWGPYWYCPLLPRDDVAIHTVVGSPIQLPQIDNPTDEEVAKYHKIYIDALVAMYDRHKATFGYADRRLEVC